MEEALDEEVDIRQTCEVCGEKEFNLREGYYYCAECGTKHNHVRAIEVEQNIEFEDGKHTKKQKIQQIKTEKPELTSWECYNYILRGFVEELLSIGAKEELKLMALQVWAAFLRRQEVAFFNKRHAQLPKLGVRFLKNDARALYNQFQKMRRKRKRRRSDEASTVSGSSKGREWQKTVRKLDESIYSDYTTSQTYSSDGSLSNSRTSATSSSGTTSRAIPLRYSSRARKYFKSVMSSKHLSKHEQDVEHNMNCHKNQPKVCDLKYPEHALTTMSIKHVYSVLAIALNLIEDDIQFSDLVRFIHEGRMSNRNVLQYFPDNIVPYSKQLLCDINFYLYSDTYPDKALREHVDLLAKNINIRGFKKPDIFKLALRYITDLNLPKELATFVQRLINLLPPEMQTRAPHHYPYYEARAMAYVVFVLKLLFGLDGYKEKLMSASAQHINRKIQQLGEERGKHATLFVWSEWMEYVETRKRIVSKYNSSYCRQFKLPQSIAQKIKQHSDELECQHEQETMQTADLSKIPTKVLNMQRIFGSFLENHSQELKVPELPAVVEPITFKPTLTPSHSYFKHILLHSGDADIPEFMRLDHTDRTLQPFLNAKHLRQYFGVHELELKVRRIGVTKRRNFVGTFRPYAECQYSTNLRKADFDIEEKDWLTNLKTEPLMNELEFDKVSMRSLNNLERTSHDVFIPDDDAVHGSSVLYGNKRTSALPINSIDIFGEDDMEPIQHLPLHGPRRHLEATNIFAQVSDSESDQEEVESEDEHVNVNEETINARGNIRNESISDDFDSSNGSDKKVRLITSKMDCWILLGIISSLLESQKNELESQFSRSFLWLLETCAQTIGVDCSVVYDQLLTIELMFAYGIEKLDNFQDCIQYKYNSTIKEIDVLVNSHRKVW